MDSVSMHSGSGSGNAYAVLTLIRLGAGWATLAFTSAFLLGNVEQLGETTGRYLLVGAASSGGLLLLVSRRFEILLRPNKPAFWFWLFALYFVTCYLIDSITVGVRGVADLREVTLGTSGGIIFGTGLGYLNAFALSEVAIVLRSTSRGMRRFASWTVLVYLGYVLYSVYSAFEANLASIGPLQFLIQDWGGAYQRAGDNAFIQLLIAGGLTSAIFSVKKRLPTFHAWAAAVLTTAITSILIPLSQLLGSNAGLVTVLGYYVVGVATIYALASIPELPIGNLPLYRRTVLRASMRAVGTLAVAAGLLIATWQRALEYIGVDKSQLRIFGYGSEEVFSITSRLSLLSENYLRHLSYSPIFGNTQVDALTTGPGTYAHSFLAILSHLGLVGFALFLILLGSMIYRHTQQWRFAGDSEDRFAAFFASSSLMFVTGFGFAATFYTWLPFWFAVGFFGLGSPRVERVRRHIIRTQ